MHNLIEIISHMDESEKDTDMFPIVYPMKLKYLKYWKDIPLLYSFAFVLDPRGKMRGMFNVLQIMQEKTGNDYTAYYAKVRTELFKLFNKYDEKYGSSRTQRRSTLPGPTTGKKKNPWEVVFGGPGASGVVGPAPSSVSTSSAAPCVCELSAYLDCDNVTAYVQDFDLLLWWKDHKLTFPVLSIMAKDIFSIPVSTVSSESCFSLSGRIIEERRRRLLPEHVEMLACIKDWELGDRRLQHSAGSQDLADSFENLYLDVPEDQGGSGNASTSAATPSGSVSVASAPGPSVAGS
jgi:hypothetical protein